MNNVALFGIPLAAIVVAVVQACKEAGLPGRLAPIVSLGVGIASGVALQFAQPVPNWLQGVVIGAAIGLSASGLYSSVSAYVSPATVSALESAVTHLEPATPAPTTPAPSDRPAAA